MKHFTSYYANFANIPKDYMCIGISRVCPEWFKGNTISNFSFYKDNVLAPSAELLHGYKNGSIPQEEYTKIYITGLLTRVQTELKQPSIPAWIDYMDSFYELKCYTHWTGLVFMCYETPSSFCHRHLFRRLLNNVYHIPCEEYGCKPCEVWGYKPEHQSSKDLF